MRRSSSTSNSEPLRRVLRPTALFLALLLAVTLAAGALMRALRPYEEQSWRVQDDMVSEFFATEKNTVNCLLIGNSHMMCGVDPDALDAAVPGMRCYNLAASSQLPDTTFHLLREALRRQTPTLVVMDLYHLFLATDHDDAQSSLILKPMPFCAERVSMFFDLYTPEEQGRLIRTWFDPFPRMKNLLVYRWRLARGTAVPAVNDTGTYIGRGYFSLGDRQVDVAGMVAQYTADPEQYDGLSEVQKGYVRRIAALCEEAGTRLLFVSAPMAPTYLTLCPFYDAAARDVAELARDCRTDYYDFSAPAYYEAMGLTDADFADRTHMNLSGAEKYSRFLGAFLQQNGYYPLE